jgi:membrane protease YdiL (CAAX protease family)
MQSASPTPSRLSWGVIPDRLSIYRLWALLPARLVLFLFFQALFAAGIALTGPDAWQQSARWWTAAVSLTNLVCLFLLVRFYREEGGSYRALFRIQRKHVKGDLLALLGMMLIAGPVSMLPNTMLASALYGDSLAPARLLFAPLPEGGLFFALVLFPITQGLVELAYYFLYVMPRLAQKINPWLAYILASFFLGIQHVAVPLLFDSRFILWRALMYLPFAFLIGGILKWRPRLLPYVAIVHMLIDLAAAAMYLMPF